MSDEHKNIWRTNPSAYINPFDKHLQREAIDKFKQHRMRYMEVAKQYANLTQEDCVQYWIEQQADAELYQERWHELEAEKGEQ